MTQSAMKHQPVAPRANNKRPAAAAAIAEEDENGGQPAPEGGKRKLFNPRKAGARPAFLVTIADIPH